MVCESVTARAKAMTSDRLLNVDEVAAILKVAKGTVYHMASEGRLPCVRLSARCLRFRESEIWQYIETMSEHVED